MSMGSWFIYRYYLHRQELFHSASENQNKNRPYSKAPAYHQMICMVSTFPLRYRLFVRYHYSGHQRIRRFAHISFNEPSDRVRSTESFGTTCFDAPVPSKVEELINGAIGSRMSSAPACYFCAGLLMPVGPGSLKIKARDGAVLVL